MCGVWDGGRGLRVEIAGCRSNGLLYLAGWRTEDGRCRLYISMPPEVQSLETPCYKTNTLLVNSALALKSVVCGWVGSRPPSRLPAHTVWSCWHGYLFSTGLPEIACLSRPVFLQLYTTEHHIMTVTDTNIRKNPKPRLDPTFPLQGVSSDRSSSDVGGTHLLQLV